MVATSIATLQGQCFRYFVFEEFLNNFTRMLLHLCQAWAFLETVIVVVEKGKEGGSLHKNAILLADPEMIYHIIFLQNPGCNNLPYFIMVLQTFKHFQVYFSFLLYLSNSRLQPYLSKKNPLILKNGPDHLLSLSKDK